MNTNNVLRNTIVIEGLLQSKTINENTMTLVLDVIHATATVPKTMIIHCERQAYAAYFEQMRVHKNTYIITSISLDGNAATHVQWIAIPAMTTQIQAMVSNHRRKNTLQNLANQTTIGTVATQHDPVTNVEKSQRQEHSHPPKNEMPQHTPEPQAITREQPQIEPEATTTQLKTSDIVLAALKHNTGKLHQYQTTSTGYKEHGYA